MRRSFTRGAVAVLCALVASTAMADVLYSTSFEPSEGYTNDTQLGAYPDWTGDGQDATGWLVTDQLVGGSGASTGTQWVLASSPTATTGGRWQWAVTPVTDFSILNEITAAADVKIASRDSGTINKSTLGGLQMYTAAVELIGGIYLMHDAENLYGLGAGRMLLEFVGADPDDGWAYDLGVADALDQYVELGLKVDFATDTVYGYLNGDVLPDTVGAGGATDFHDLDMFAGSAATGTGRRARVGFDNYYVAQTPEPASAVLLILGGLLLRRR